MRQKLKANLACGSQACLRLRAFALNGQMLKGGSKETVSKLTYRSGFQPFYLMSRHYWGFAPGWYGIAPLAAKSLRNHNIKGPKARSISAWGNAPGINRDNESRAESPLHASFETVSKLSYSQSKSPKILMDASFETASLLIPPEQRRERSDSQIDIHPGNQQRASMRAFALTASGATGASWRNIFNISTAFAGLPERR